MDNLKMAVECCNGYREESQQLYEIYGVYF